MVITEAEATIGSIQNIDDYDTFVANMTVKDRIIIFAKKDLKCRALHVGRDVPIVILAVDAVPGLAVGGVYRQFSHLGKEKGQTKSSFSLEQKDLKSILDAVTSIADSYHKFHMLGDWNLNPEQLNNPNFCRNTLLRDLLNTMEDLGLELQLTTEPTWTSPGLYKDGDSNTYSHRESKVDLIFSRGPISVPVCVEDNTMSDHRPVSISIPGGRTRRRQRAQRTIRRARNYKAMDRDLFLSALYDHHQFNISDNNSLSTNISNLYQWINTSLDVAAPVEETEMYPAGSRLSPETRKTMQERNAAFKEPGRPRYKRLRNRVVSLAKRDKAQHVQKRLKKDPNALWDVLREVTNRKKVSDSSNESDSVALQCANEQNTFFVDKINKIRARFPPDKSVTQPPELSQTPPESMFTFHKIGASELKRAIKLMKNTASTGTDELPILVWKAGLDALCLSLLTITNQIISTSHWPEEWKESIIVPVPKPGKPAGVPSSYRPIALLTSVSKIIEKVLYLQLEPYVEEFVLPAEQHGFRRSRGTDTAVATLMSGLAMARSKCMKATISCFDYSAAFDTVNCSVLADRMSSWMTPSSIALIVSYLSGGRQKVRHGDKFSDLLDIKYGVRQGSILGPLLFIIYTAGLPDVARALGILAGVYADDTSGLSIRKTWEESDSSMEAFESKLAEFSRNSELALNEDKTQRMRIDPSSKTRELNILGLTLDCDGQFKTHHEKMHKATNQRIGAIKNLRACLSAGRDEKLIARSAVYGKLQTNVWITREIRLNPNDTIPGHEKELLVTLNRLARHLTGDKRIDHIRISDLLDRAGLPTINELVVARSALAAWTAAKGGALSDLLQPSDTRTRSAAAGLLQPRYPHCTAASNMANIWNYSEELRKAKSKNGAKRIGKKIGRALRMV